MSMFPVLFDHKALERGVASCTMLDRLDGSLSAGNTITSNADGLIEFICTALGDDNLHIVEYRRVDASNRWRFAVTQTGQVLLYENTTLRASTLTGACGNGDKVKILTSGTIHRFYINDTLVANYTSATYQTASGARVAFIDPPGVLSDLKSWPVGCPAGDADKYP